MGLLAEALNATDRCHKCAEKIIHATTTPGGKPIQLDTEVVDTPDANSPSRYRVDVTPDGKLLAYHLDRFDRNRGLPGHPCHFDTCDPKPASQARAQILAEHMKDNGMVARLGPQQIGSASHSFNDRMEVDSHYE